MSSRLQPFKLLASMHNEYAVIKLIATDSSIKAGSDIDIVCANRHSFARELIGKLNELVDDSTHLLIYDTPWFTHVDVMKKNTLVVKFDLINRFHYRKFKLRADFAEEVLRQKVRRTHNKHRIFVADKIDDGVVRKLEYLNSNQKKIHHLEYLQDLDIKTQDQINNLFDSIVRNRWWWLFDGIRTRFNL